MFLIDLLLLALHTVIFPDPGVERIFIDPQVAGCLGNRLLRFDGKFHGALFKLGRIAFHRWFTHRTHLSRVTIALVSVCPEEYSHFIPSAALVYQSQRLCHGDGSAVQQPLRDVWGSRRPLLWHTTAEAPS